MAQDSSNQANLRKCLASILFLIFINCATSLEYYIVPSQGYPCSVDHCLTLSQFASNFSNSSEYDNVTLIFVSGSYDLESGLLIEDIHSFSMSAEPFSSNPRIICSPDVQFEFRNVNIVTIQGLDCYGNVVVSASRFHLTESKFYSRPEHDSTILSITESTAYLERVAFLSITKGVQGHTITTVAQKPQENCTLSSETIFRVTANDSIIVIKECLFDKSIVGVGAVISDLNNSKISIFNSTFTNNRVTCCTGETCIGAILRVNGGTIALYDSRFERNHGIVSKTIGGIASFSLCAFSDNFGSFRGNFIDNEEDPPLENIIFANDSTLSINYCTFTNNTLPSITAVSSHASVVHNAFTDNNVHILMFFTYTNMSLYHNELVNNTADNLIKLVITDNMAISLNVFDKNRVDFGLISFAYEIELENITNNVFLDNHAAFDIYIDSDCEPGLSRSLGTTRCINCPELWYLNLAGLLVGGFVAGIILVILMLALNLTVAVGTLNGILFYANIISARTNAYFPLLSTPNFVSIFISWLNLDIGFDVCAFEGMTIATKAVLQLAFPAYVVVLVVVVIVIGEYSSKFASIVGKGNPVAVLATMILISFTKLVKAVIGSITLLYVQPAYGSLNVNPTLALCYGSRLGFTGTGKALLVISPLVGVLCLLYTALVFFWKWLVRYQNKFIFRWVRYQKLHHFMEPYHAPYVAQYRYWTGLLLIVRIILFSVSAINFSRDPRIDFVSTIFVIGCLVLFKGVMVKRIYKNVVIDVMETAIYFNLVFFAVFTWYSSDFGGNQVAVAYVSVVIICILLIGVIGFHLVRFTCIYKKLSFFTELPEKKNVHVLENENLPDELDGVLMTRHIPKTRYVSHTVVALS